MDLPEVPRLGDLVILARDRFTEDGVDFPSDGEDRDAYRVTEVAWSEDEPPNLDLQPVDERAGG